MAKKFNINLYDKRHYDNIVKRMQGIKDMFDEAVKSASRIGGASGFNDPDNPFYFSNYPAINKKVDELITQLHDKVVFDIEEGDREEWLLSCEKNNELVDAITRSTNIPKAKISQWKQPNLEALEAFQTRKINGMGLSGRVWNITEQLKQELELALDIGLGDGKSAADLTSDVRRYLNEPGRLFRRVRDKHGVLRLSKAAKAYHPGRGVYRSSYKNALRLTATENNIAYRTADYERWQQLPFVIGIEIKLSNNHTLNGHPFYDICDELKGKYPKDFKFTGWHPQCRCVSIPKLASVDEMLEYQEKVLNDEDVSNYHFKGEVRNMPKNFSDWWKDNQERIMASSSLPYWVRDNKKVIDRKKKRIKTEQEKKEIQDKWNERAKKHTLVIKTANNILKIAQEYPEIDLTALQSFIDKRNIGQMNNEARTVAKQIVEIRKDEKMLSALIPDVHEWKKQFTSAELHDVYDAVEKKIASWSSMSLEKQAEKLKFEWDDFLGGNMNNVQSKYKTWQVSQAAYKRKYEQVLDSIEWQNIDNVLQEALTFKTKSKPYLNLIEELQVSMSAGDKTKAQSIVADMQAKRAALKRAADARAVMRDARAVKRYGKSADGLYVGGNPFEEGELSKLKDYETRIIDGIMSGRGADHNLIAQYHDYVLLLSEKYYPKQASLFTEGERNAMKAITDKYLARLKTNPHWIWGEDLGGVYSGIDSKVNAYLPKLAGLTREELSIVQRFTNGSTFSNCYNLHNESEYWRNKFKDKLSRLSKAEIKEQHEIIEEWSQGANYTLDRMVRYNGITFRGLDSGGGPELRKVLSQAFKENKPWINNASCSTSMKLSVAGSFDGDTILIIHNKTGAYIHAISDYSKEYEIMTLRGTKYKVLAPPKRIGSRYYVELEEII